MTKGNRRTILASLRGRFTFMFILMALALGGVIAIYWKFRSGTKVASRGRSQCQYDGPGPKWRLG